MLHSCRWPYLVQLKNASSLNSPNTYTRLIDYLFLILFQNFVGKEGRHLYLGMNALKMYRADTVCGSFVTDLLTSTAQIGAIAVWREERIGLLEIKAWIEPNAFYLTDWVDDKEDDDDCCKWDRVQCDNNTRRVFELYLRNAREYNQGSEVLSSRLRKLEELDLRDNKFNDSILSSLSGLQSLMSLDLSSNIYLTGSTGINGKAVDAL
ncbi:unnamed protein product [Dovyalis caffra]|uniref:Leucine-rich repeat-containing N-terminal plant-type domain-containing protein n=1 Tax=Dovyalis caffra TaxID=77055 RepID=A0AAV1RVA9_9ROSI|nr:unnamed protein product [Dovyalis caffra]